MRKTLLLAAALGTFSLPVTVLAEEAASPHTFTYNVGLFSQYIFRGLTQTGEELALQGGVDYAHSSGFYLGSWASNISWVEDAGLYENSSLELDIYGGYASTIGETGLGYNVGILQYIYPGDRISPATNIDTTEIYGSLSYEWATLKYSHAVSSKVFGLKDADGSFYLEANANIPLGETGFTANLHVGRQEFDGSGNDIADYTDWKIGLTKSWDNGVNVGGYYTDTNARESVYTIAGDNIAEDQFTFFVQKTF